MPSMSAYATQNKINNLIEDTLKIAGPEGLIMDAFIYEVTLNYPISALYIKKRFEIMLKLGLIEIKGDKAYWALDKK